MVDINLDFFIKESDNVRVLENITKYCSNCYKELSYDDEIYLYINNYEYICNECACCLTQELDTKEECEILECQDGTLF